jgi:hypothetical protein
MKRDDNDMRLDDSARSAGADAAARREDALREEGSVERAEARLAREHGEDADKAEQTAAGAVGGVGGAAAGAAVGTVVGGPIGTAIGAIAGAIGGWWAGHATTVASDFRDDDDAYYRTEYEASPERLADRRYEDVRPAYQLGHLARRNPDYDGRPFEAIESDLEKGWTEDLRARHGDWSAVRHHACAAYSRNPDLSRETVSERTVVSASERARDRLAGGRSGLTRDDTTGY